MAINDRDSDRKKNKMGTPIYDQFVEWCENTTIHGVKYLGERERFSIERFAWIIVFIISITICGNLIHNLFLKWNDSPSIVSFSEVPTSLKEIPFPAVTICPDIKYVLSKCNTTNLTFSNPEQWTVDDVRKFEVLSSICLVEKEIFGNISNKLYFQRSDLELLIQVALRKDIMLYKCVFRNAEDQDCSIFREILIEDGLCSSFNFLEYEDIFRDEVIYNYTPHGNRFSNWTLEKNLNGKAEPFPFRSIISGSETGLSALLAMYIEERGKFCRIPVRAYKIILHSPGDIPQIKDGIFWIPNEHYGIINIKPKLITTSESLRKYEPHKRHCFFESEKYLKFFQIYTQSNCELECLTNYTLKECNCVAFHMPRIASTNICGPKNYNCLKASASKYYSDATLFPCDCLPACTSISYDVEVTSIEMNISLLAKGYEDLSDFNDNTEDNKVIPNMVAGVDIYFKRNHFLSSRRSELYTTSELIANIGGLLGLFMGISLLSFIEIIYFFTIRFYYNLKTKELDLQKKVDQQQPEAEELVNGYDK